MCMHGFLYVRMPCVYACVSVCMHVCTRVSVYIACVCKVLCACEHGVGIYVSHGMLVCSVIMVCEKRSSDSLVILIGVN